MRTSGWAQDIVMNNTICPVICTCLGKTILSCSKLRLGSLVAKTLLHLQCSSASLYVQQRDSFEDKLRNCTRILSFASSWRFVCRPRFKSSCRSDAEIEDVAHDCSYRYDTVWGFFTRKFTHQASQGINFLKFVAYGTLRNLWSMSIKDFLVPYILLAPKAYWQVFLISTWSE